MEEIHKEYISPEAKTIDVNVMSVLCLSNLDEEYGTW